MTCSRIILYLLGHNCCAAVKMAAIGKAWYDAVITWQPSTLCQRQLAKKNEKEKRLIEFSSGLAVGE